MTKAIAATYDKVHGYRMQISSILLAGSILAIGAYIWSVYSMVSHTVALGKVEVRAGEVVSAIGDLDAAYLELSSALTPDVLAQYGYSAGKATAFIPRTTASVAAGQVLAAAGHEL